MSRDVITVGSTIRIPLLYRGEYSQWRERTAQNAPPTLKDPKFWTTEEKKTRKIDRLAGSLLIQGLPNDIILSLIATKLLKTYGMLLKGRCVVLRDVNDALGYKKKAVVVHSDPLALVAEKTNVSKRKKKVVVFSNSEGSGSDDFSELKKITALLANAFNRRKFYSKPTNNNLRTSSTSQQKSAKIKRKLFFSSDSEGSEVNDFSELKKITALLAKVFNRRKFYSKPTNNNLRKSSSSQSANKKQEFVKTDTKKVEKKMMKKRET
nr:hypothetical protein [Tanacetum cinerariifolium]